MAKMFPIEPEQKRRELDDWIEKQCRDQKLWITLEDGNIVGLMHYEPQMEKIILVVVREGFERIGIGTGLVRELQKKRQY